MQRFLMCSIGLMLAGSLAAQVAVDGVTGSAVGAAATAGAAKDADSVAKDTKLPPSLGVTAAVKGAVAGTNAMIGGGHMKGLSAIVANKGLVTGRDASFTGSANTTGDGGRPGPHTFSFTFSAPSPTPGKLNVSLGGTATKNAQSTGKITIGRQSWDWKAGDPAVNTSIDVTLDSTGVTAVITSAGSASLSGPGDESYMGMFSVSFAGMPVTLKCTVTDNKDGCRGGPSLAGSVSSGKGGEVVDLKLTQAAKSSIGILFHSADGRTVQLPNGCPLFLSPVAPSVFLTDANGEADQHVGVPRNTAFKTFVNAAVLEISTNGLAVTSSNTLTIECK